MNHDTKTINFKQEMLGGFSAGIVGTVIGYPLDLVKTRMQTSSDGKGFLRVGSRIVRREGFLALYKGMAPPLISLAILNTGNFTSYNYFRNLFGSERGWDIRNGIAGAMGCWGSTVSTVEHMIKTQMQLDNVGNKRYRGSWHCMTTLMRESGWSVIYTGHAINTLREVVFLGTYFYTYEGLRVFLQQCITEKDVDKNHISPWTVPIAGGVSGAWAWFVSFPLDCIKAGVQGQDLSRLDASGKKGTWQKRKSMDVLKGLLRTKGWKGLYSGVTPSIMRAFIVSGSRFSAYEVAVKLFGDYLS
mmetsp:Transcript_15426/g.29097  ORF Transcript_15426/g.29097 Transcript_15426/m.29097 type:complete len:301 (+) Transcript_15426:147-1049(+)